MVKGSFLEIGFKATLSSKTNVLSVWKLQFSVFGKILSDEVETIFSESEAQHSKLFKSKFGQRKLLRSWFWSYLELKSERSKRWKRAFLSFFARFWVTKLKSFSGEVRESFQNYLNQNLVIGSFLENGLEATLSSKMNVLRIWKGHFQFFANFWVTKLKPFPCKMRQSIQNYWNQNLVIRSFLKNGFEATFRSKKNVLSVWKGHFSIFGKI